MKNEKIEDIKDRAINLDTKSVFKKVKKFGIITLSSAIILGIAGVGAGFYYVKSNINYTQSDCQKIALEKIPGEVIKTEKDIDEDTLSLTYEFKIKGKDNLLNEVEVDSKSGAIVDINHADSTENNIKDEINKDVKDINENK